MPQHAHKSTHAKTSHKSTEDHAKNSHKSTAENPKHSHPVAHTKKALEKTENKVLEMENENINHVQQAATASHKTSSKLAHIHADNLESVIESGGNATHILQNVGNEIQHSNTRELSMLSKMSKEVASCRNLNDMLMLQNEMIHRTFNNYLEMTQNIYSVLFDSYNEVMEPLNKRSIKASKALHKALAA